MDATTILIIAVIAAGVLVAAGVLAVAWRRGPSAAPIVGEFDKAAAKRDVSVKAVVKEEAATAAVAEPDAPETAAHEEHEPIKITDSRQVVTKDEYGVTRRKFLNRAALGLFGGGFIGTLGISMLAFFWPKLRGGFGSKVNLGLLDDLRSQVVPGDGTIHPLFVPEAQTWLVPMEAKDLPGSSFEGLPVVGRGGRRRARFDGAVAEVRAPRLPGPRLLFLAGIRVPLPRLEVQLPRRVRSGPCSSQPRSFHCFRRRHRQHDRRHRRRHLDATRKSQDHQVSPGAILPVSTLFAPLLATAESEPVGPSNVGLGAIVLTIAVVVFLVWVGYVVINTRRRTHRQEKPAPNQEFFMDNAGLENDRLTRVLTAAVIAAGVLAIVMPIYFVNESSRQKAAAEEINLEYVHFGEQWWTKFACTTCHGPDGGGGGALIPEPRSGLDATWAVPSLNDVFYRYDESEVRHWITYGRAGTPMPANGLEGGGAMTVQEIDQVIDYIRSIQLDQADAVAKADGIVETALARLDNAEATIQTRLLVEQTKLDDINDGPRRFGVIKNMPDDIIALLSTDGTCTDDSAALVGTTCSVAGTDTDRDGLTDDAELALTEMAQTAFAEIVTHSVDTTTNEITEVVDNGFDVTFDPSTGYSMNDATGNPLPDLETASALITHVNAKHLELSLLDERKDQFAQPVIDGMAFLQAALEQRAWEVDFQAVADKTGLSLDDATRAVGLFNGYCARCHTAGYSAGVEFQQEPGSGAWAPALTQGRAITQFPNVQDHIDFVTEGAQASTEYGVNGISQVGGMPGFGALLSERDIELIVAYERSL